MGIVLTALCLSCVEVREAIEQIKYYVFLLKHGAKVVNNIVQAKK